MDANELEKRTTDFALEVIELCPNLPNNYTGEVVGKQLLHSVTPVAVNYQSACRARSQAEFASELQIVIEESDECLFGLELMAESNLLPENRVSQLLQEADDLTAIFVASRKTITAKIHRSQSV